ncbi:hypothetical protein B0H66DRAFT_94539 [Apodospora peruviana]|uniref:Zn(2)-C6 fungal-type domain-containing protein n=1 Tax=Apodospora peruviana TaxID=516989 RepID=A0AAE0MG34_9PEZI|nr:hypothetical protein B0H66DRAFT_94539 [Apodospora peruviana]
MDRSDMDRDSAEGPDGSGLRRACDQCRLRKIRCNKESPCANCRTASRQCSSTGVGQKPKEARQRVLISSQYERKIDHFESRLAGIENMLRELNTSINNNTNLRGSSTDHTEALYRASRHGSSSVSGDQTETVFSDDAADDEPTPNFEGGSSMAAQTAYASEFLENAVTQTSLRDVSPDMQSALLSLQQIVQLQNSQSTKEIRFPYAKPLPRGGIRELAMPPMPFVINLLREIKDTPPVTFTLICAFISVEDFTENCRKVYFATEDYSLATFIIVNTGLCYLFQEKSTVATTEARAAELLKHHATCRNNLETALSTLPMLMPARMDNVKALLLGASYAVEIAKLTLAWQLSTSAALMCLSLGYHRLSLSESSPENETANDAKSGLFWFAYMLDKGLSLRFGRSSVIQDYDISMPKVVGPQFRVSDPWKVVLSLWIAHSELLGRVYEQLYSPGALLKPLDQRIATARTLAEEIKVLAKRSSDLEKQVLGPGKVANGGQPVGMYSLDLVLRSDEVSYWSTLALVCRAIPAAGPGTNVECVEAARRATALHHECLQLTESTFTKAAYLHWTLIYAPFVPYIVLFCHVIETSDADDLRRMAEFVESLAPMCHISEAIDKLHRVCQVLNNVALLYVEAKAQRQQLQQTDNTQEDMAMVGNDFDMYLSQLGFIAPSDIAVNGGGFDGGGMNGSDIPVIGTGVDMNPHTSQLGNWFSGNRHILGLVEADPSEYEPRVWGAM